MAYYYMEVCTLNLGTSAFKIGEVDWWVWERLVKQTYLREETRSSNLIHKSTFHQLYKHRCRSRMAQ